MGVGVWRLNAATSLISDQVLASVNQGQDGKLSTDYNLPMAHPFHIQIKQKQQKEEK